MVLDNRSIFEIKVDALTRLFLQNTVSGILPIYIVTEYQKSGGSWVGQMLSEYMDIPFPRNCFPVFKKSVQHGHLLPKPTMNNVVCVFRDGRDAVVSSYFHMLFESDKNSPKLVAICRDSLQFENYSDVYENLPKFIEYLFTEHHSRTLWRQNQFTWSEFVDAWWQRGDVVKVKYEDLIADCMAVMTEVLNELTSEAICVERLNDVVDKFSFENQTKRKPGVENTKSFLRKGQSGDWKEKFSLESAQVFEHFAGKQLIALGYESDSRWVSSFS